MICSSCGTDQPQGAVSCTHCGAQMPPPQQHPDPNQAYNQQQQAWQQQQYAQQQGYPQQGYGQPPGYPQGGYPMPQPTTSGMAIAGFVLSFFCALLGLIFSAIAIGQINRSQGMQTGKGLAIAGLVISIVNMFLGIVIAASGGIDLR